MSQTFYFYSTSDSKEPSGYYKRLPLLLAHLSKAGIFHFKLWAGTHDAPIPVDEEKEYPIMPNTSEAALAKVDTTGLRALVAKEYASRPQGATPDEIMASLFAQGHHVTSFSIRPRCTELKKARLLFPTGERRFGCAVLTHRIYWKGVR
jgi:hypothetical protein